jgi:hypothetical protein
MQITLECTQCGQEETSWPVQYTLVALIVNYQFQNCFSYPIISESRYSTKCDPAGEVALVPFLAFSVHHSAFTFLLECAVHGPFFVFRFCHHWPRGKGVC